MRGQRIRLICLILLAMAALFTQVTPVAAIGGNCGQCRNSYESCMTSRYNANGGYVTPDDEELCGSMTADCWAMCQSTIPTMCTYTYDFYACGTWVSGAGFQANYMASHYCSDYIFMHSTSNCY